MAEATASSEKPIRVMLWGLPRSVTTALEKCISFVDDIQVINEAFSAAYTTGPERNENDMMAGITGFMDKAADTEDFEYNGWENEECTFQWVKDTMEKDYPGKKIIFCKDIVTAMPSHMDMIPQGFRHTFIIRNPMKTFLSLRKLIIKNFLPLLFISPDDFDLDTMNKLKAQLSGEEVSNPYKETVDLVEYLKDHGEAHPVIVDADDLQNHPASILKQYCEAVGIPYSDSLLEWEAGDEIVKKNWFVSKTMMKGNKIGDYYGAAFNSTKFVPATPLPPEEEIPKDVVTLGKEADPYYQKLYEMRIRP